MISSIMVEPEILEVLKKSAIVGRRYQFFDTFVRINTNNQEILNNFDKIYWRFRRDEKLPLIKPEEHLYIVEYPAHSSTLMVIFKEEYQILEDQITTPNLYLFIFSYILPNVVSHFLVHAATLSHNDRATVITAHSTSGKTTLAVELIKRGIKFLSDELAPIHRTINRVDPFPRSIGLRNLALHHLSEYDQERITRAPNAKGEIKFMIDPEILRPGAVAGACPCRHVIFLEPQFEETSASEQQQILEICLTRLNRSLLLSIQNIQDVLKVEIVEDRIFPMLRLLVPKEAHVLQEIESSVHAYESALVSVVNGRTRKPDYNLTPILRPMSKMEGTFELAKMILNAHPQTLLMKEFNQKPALMLSHLADITQTFQFHKLMVGKLDLMTDIVEDLMRNS